MLRTTAVISLAFMIVILLGGLTEGKKPGGEPQPCDGSPIEVLVNDLCGMSKWIAVTDSTTVCQILCPYLAGGGPGKNNPCEMIPGWIGGTVIADPSAPDGYYFDPGTVRVYETTLEGYQTTLCFIRDRPGFFNGGLWFVHAFFQGVRPL